MTLKQRPLKEQDTIKVSANRMVDFAKNSFTLGG